MSNILVKWLHYLWISPKIWEILIKIHTVAVIVGTNEGTIQIFLIRQVLSFGGL